MCGAKLALNLATNLAGEICFVADMCISLTLDFLVKECREFKRTCLQVLVSKVETNSDNYFCKQDTAQHKTNWFTGSNLCNHKCGDPFLEPELGLDSSEVLGL